MRDRYFVEIAPAGFDSIRRIGDKKIRREIARAIEDLAVEPIGSSKALVGVLEGYRSLKVVRHRYRVLYKVDAEAARVSVLLVGERKPGLKQDVYALAEKLVATLLRRPATD